MGEHRLDVNGGLRYLSETYHSPTSMVSTHRQRQDTEHHTATCCSRRPPVPTPLGRQLSYYGSVAYNYKEKYYLDGAFSFETSSRFGKDTRRRSQALRRSLGLLPQPPGRMGHLQRRLVQGQQRRQLLKVNAGFESVGNDDVNNMATPHLSAGWRDVRSQSASSNGSLPYISRANIGNTNTSAGRTTNRFHAGLDGNVFNNRLNLKFNFFKSWTSNLVSLGTHSPTWPVLRTTDERWQAGNMGFDVALTGKVINLDKFKVELGASIGHYKNEITALPGNNAAFETDISTTAPSSPA